MSQKCAHCGAGSGVVEVPVGEGSERLCWPCVGLEPEDDQREAERVATLKEFDRSVRPFLAVLRRIALRLTRNAADADDVVQDALVKAMIAWPNFKCLSEQKTGAWLAVILKRCFVDQWRRQTRDPGTKYYVDVAIVPEHAEAWAEYIDAQRAIERLDGDQRNVLELAMIGVPYHEIASRLAIPLGTVMSRLYRARRVVEALL